MADGGFTKLPGGTVVVALTLPRPLVGVGVTGAPPAGSRVRVLVHAVNRQRALTRLRNLGLRAVYLRGNAHPPTPDEITAVLYHPDGLVWRSVPDDDTESWHPIGALLRPAARPAPEPALPPDPLPAAWPSRSPDGPLTTWPVSSSSSSAAPGWPGLPDRPASEPAGRSAVEARAEPLHGGGGAERVAAPPRPGAASPTGAAQRLPEAARAAWPVRRRVAAAEPPAAHNASRSGP